jgi:hypothetical protein
MTALLRWVRAHDPEYGALRRAGRIAIVVPAMLAIGFKVLGSPSIAIFAGLGSIATLLFVDFRGPRRVRLEEQMLLALSSGALVVVGTLVSRWTWLSAVTMTLIAFVVLFSGVISLVLASAGNAQLVGLIVAVSFPAGPDAIPDRLAGWGMACGASLIAITVFWPAPVHDRLEAWRPKHHWPWRPDYVPMHHCSDPAPRMDLSQIGRRPLPGIMLPSVRKGQMLMHGSDNG